MKVYIKGLNSCVNRKRDLDRYAEFISENGHQLVHDAKQSDITLLWTCAFRKDYRDNSLNEIHQLKNECKELVVCGCLPDIDKEGLVDEFDGKYFRWKDEENHLPEIFGGTCEQLRDLSNDSLGERDIGEEIELYKEKNPEKKVIFADQFVKLFISEGCTFKCTYCAEILAFPKYRSFPIDSLVEKCKKLVDLSGQHKVVLWADSLGDYGRDINSSLPELIDVLYSEVPGISIGLEHLHPARFIEYYDELSELILQGKIWLVDVPIQSASNKILKLMNRMYEKKDIEKVFSLVGESTLENSKTHIIVGFPGETEEDYNESIDFLLRHAPKSVLVSGYMESPGMPSKKLPNKVGEMEIRKRVLNAAEILSKKGIACNYDNSSISQEHFSKSFVNFRELS